MAYFDTKKDSLEEAIKAAVSGQINEATITFQSHDGRNKDFKNLVRKNRLKITTVGDGSQIGKNSDTVVSGDAKGIQNVLQTMYGDDWKEMYKLKGGNYVDIDEAKGTTKYVVMQGPGDNNQKVIATFDGGDNALQKAKKFRDDWNTKNKRKIKLDKKGKPISAHMARIFAKGAETSYKVGNKVSYSEFAPSLVKEENLDETNKNNKSDDGEGMDAVQPKAVKKKFDDRKDKDIDNDGDTDASDKYLHKRRKAVSKAVSKEEVELEEGTSAVPTSMADFRGIADIMKRPIKAKDAERAISKYIRDDDIANGIISIKEKDPNADVRSAIMKGFNKLEIRTRGEPSYGAVIKFNRKFEIADKRQKTYLDRSPSEDQNNMKTISLRGGSKVRAEGFEYGTPEATENSLNMTPGQSSKEWDEQVGIMHKKQNTMRETVAKMWGVEEGHNPFKKEEEKNPKKESKTLTGKPATKVSVNSDEKKD